MSASREVEGVQVKEPVLGMLSPKQSIGMTFSEGPRRSTSETVPLVVGWLVLVRISAWGLFRIRYVRSR